MEVVLNKSYSVITEAYDGYVLPMSAMMMIVERVNLRIPTTICLLAIA
jgi:hypothetical protein